MWLKPCPLLINACIIYLIYACGSKTLRRPHQKMYESDFRSIKSTLNVSKVSTFKVTNRFLENIIQCNTM